MNAFHFLFRIPFHEVDAAGVMFHAHLFSHAHDAYSALMQEFGQDLKTLLREGTYLVPLVHAEADFKRPMELDDEIRIELQALPPGSSSMGFRYRFNKGDQLCATAVTRHVFLDRNSRKPVALPPELKKQLQAFPDRTPA